MKQLDNYIQEKLKLDKDFKINNNEIIDLDLVPEEYKEHVEKILPFDIETQGKQLHINKCAVVKGLKTYKFYQNQSYIFSCRINQIDDILKGGDVEIWGYDFKRQGTGHINIKVI